MGRVTGKPTGRPAFEPTKEDRKRVLALIGFGFTEAQVASLIFHNGKPISERTLRKYFAPEIERGLNEVNSQVVLSLFKKATGDGPQAASAAMFWVKCRMGWRDVSRTEVTGPNGGPINIYSDSDLAKLTDAELETTKTIITKLQQGARAAVDAEGDE